MKSGFLLIVSGPSGAGKGTICEEVVKEDEEIKLSISCTTRPPRKGEEEGVHYFFLSEDEFKLRINRGEFLEHALVHDSYYGTPEQFVRDEIDSGKVIILEIDVQGALQVAEKLDNVVMVFVAPPSMKELEQRLIQRATDDEEVIARRLKNAKGEMEHIKEYDYLIINDKLEDSIASMRAIIMAERHRTERSGGIK